MITSLPSPIRTEERAITARYAAKKTVTHASGGPHFGNANMPVENKSVSNSDPIPKKDVVILSDAGEARRVQEEVEDALKRHLFTPQEIFSIKLALEEALVNAIKHGNQMDRAKSVRVAYHVTSERFDVWVTDEGPGFDPADIPDCTAVENLERPCGRGLMLMRHYMTEVDYNASGNAVYMSKRRGGK